MLVNTWLVLADFGKEVVSESNLSFIIILKITPPGEKTPRPFLTEHAQCENADQVLCK